MKSPKPSGSWAWEFNSPTEANLTAAVNRALQVGTIMKNHRLLDCTVAEVDWIIPKMRPIGIKSQISLLNTKVEEEGLAQVIQDSKPTAYADAIVSRLKIQGTGSWIDSHNQHRNEYGLADISLKYIENRILIVDINVYHDIWTSHDFQGNRHTQIYSRNAPRLEAALSGVESIFGEPPEPDDPTYFGTPTTYGVEAPTDADGEFMDVTDKL